MDSAGGCAGLLVMQAAVVDGRIDHDGGGSFGIRSGYGTTCNGPCSSITPSTSSSSLGSNSSFCETASSSSSSYSSSSSDLMDDATSPSSRPSPLYEMAALMADLPIKRGLSQHFQGKSQSFASLAAVASVDDLVKPDRGSWRQRFSRGRVGLSSACKSKSCAAGLSSGHAPPISPNGRAISKPRRRNSGGNGGTLWGVSSASRQLQHALLFA